MPDPLDQNEPITSSLAEDPEFADLLIMFVEELWGRIDQLERAVPAADHEAIHRLAHSIKGSAGGYGFDVITVAANELDMLAKAEAQVDQLVDSFNALTGLCERVSI